MSNELIVFLHLKETTVEYTADVLRLIELLYAAAGAPGEWRSALAALADVCRANHAILLARETGSDVALVAAYAGMDDDAFARFLSPVGMRLVQPLQRMLPPGIAVDWSELMSDQQFEETAFFNEVIGPAAGFYTMAAHNTSAATSSFVALCRTRQAGNFAAADAAKLQLLLPHLTRALELHSRLQEIEQGSRHFARLLDCLNIGIVLVDARARPVFVNRQAAGIADRKDGLALGEGTLAAGAPRATQQLRDAVCAAIGDGATGTRRLLLTRPSGRPPLLVTLVSMTRNQGAARDARKPHVAILIKEPDDAIDLDRAVLAEAFSLTPRESDVAVRIAAGLDLEQVATELALNVTTVRSHLRQLFDKTGMRSQPKLAGLMHGFANPAADPSAIACGRGVHSPG